MTDTTDLVATPEGGAETTARRSGGLSTMRLAELHKLDINQGNYISQDMVDKLKVGQPRQQVRLILGTPLLVTVFRDDRWDYTYLFARQIAVIFTYSPESAHLAPEIAAFLAIMCFFYPFIPPGVMSGSIFQATGRGVSSLIMTVLRNLVFIAVFSYLFGIVLGFGEHGVWWGIVAGDILGGTVAFLWARTYISRLIANQ